MTSGVAVTVTIMFVSQDDALKIRCEIDSDIDVMLRSMAAIVVIPNAKVTSRGIRGRNFHSTCLWFTEFRVSQDTTTNRSI